MSINTLHKGDDDDDDDDDDDNNNNSNNNNNIPDVENISSCFKGLLKHLFHRKYSLFQLKMSFHCI